MYKKVIVAIDLSECSQSILNKALELVSGNQDSLVLAHVVEPIPLAWSMESYSIDPVDLHQRIENIGKIFLQDLGTKYGIDESRQIILHGAVSTELRRLSQEVGANVIVIGSHGHSGWKLMLGSNATKLLHGMKCDVLTVYVGD